MSVELPGKVKGQGVLFLERRPNSDRKGKDYNESISLDRQIHRMACSGSTSTFETKGRTRNKFFSLSVSLSFEGCGDGRGRTATVLDVATECGELINGKLPW